MHFCFVDDTRQDNPTRPKMGSMIALGGLILPAEKVKPLEMTIEKLCLETGFPEGQVFKWSPGRELWMHDNLTGDARREFQFSVVQLLSDQDSKAVFIAEDKRTSCAESSSESHEIDIVKLLVERVDWYFVQNRTTGIIICDRPGGDFKQEEKFLTSCLETIRTGTAYRMPSTVNMAILSCPFRLSRLLQAADLIASSTLAYVCGESEYSPAIVEKVKPLFCSELGRIGGVGVKLHPFMKYVNLYHWLFGDTHYVKYPVGTELPLDAFAFSKSPDEY